ncbi:MAG: winged helix-turn-helix transcriptional regulator [Promethearchaeota archaeon]
MVKNVLENYRELIKLIPSIQSSVLKGFERDQKTHVNGPEQIMKKANVYRETFNIIQGRWTLEIYYSIMMLKKCSFNELLNKALPGINSRTLTDRLRFLEQKNIVKRTVMTESPIRVQYELTDFGKEALSLFFPFIFYCSLPKIVRKRFPKFQTLEYSAREYITQELDDPKQIK